MRLADEAEAKANAATDALDELPDAVAFSLWVALATRLAYSDELPEKQRDVALVVHVAAEAAKKGKG